MQGRLVVGWWSRGGGVAAKKPELMRLMVTKASNRAAVHGVKLPIPDTIDVCERYIYFPLACFAAHELHAFSIFCFVYCTIFFFFLLLV